MQQSLENQLIVCARKLSMAGTEVLNSGNISIREGNTIVIKPSGKSYESLEVQDVSVVALDGLHVSGLKPSSDLSVHLTIYRSRPNVRCIIHTHSHYATVMSVLQRSLEPLCSMHADYFGTEIPCLPYVNHRTKNFGTSFLAANVKACLLSSHGVLVVDEVPALAVEKAIVLEEIG